MMPDDYLRAVDTNQPAGPEFADKLAKFLHDHNMILKCEEFTFSAPDGKDDERVCLDNHLPLRIYWIEAYSRRAVHERR